MSTVWEVAGWGNEYMRTLYFLPSYAELKTTLKKLNQLETTIHAWEYYLAINKEGTFAFTITWLDCNGSRLNKSEKDKYLNNLTHMWNPKKKNRSKKPRIFRYREQTGSCQRFRGGAG